MTPRLAPAARTTLACAALVAGFLLPAGAGAADLELKVAESVGPTGSPGPGTFGDRLRTAIPKAGDRVVSSAPIVVLAEATADVTGDAGAFHAKVRCSVRASRRDTAEVLVTWTGTAEAPGPTAEVAAKAALTKAADQAATVLHERLLAKGIAQTPSPSVSLTLHGVLSYEMLGIFKEALSKLPGVGAIEQRSYGDRTARLEVACSCDGPALAAALPPQLTPTWYARVDDATPAGLVLTLVLGTRPAPAR